MSKIYFDIFGLFSKLRACSASVATSGLFFDAGKSVFSSKGVQRSGEAKTHVYMFFKTHVFFFCKKVGFPTLCGSIFRIEGSRNQCKMKKRMRKRGPEKVCELQQTRIPD